MALLAGSKFQLRDGRFVTYLYSDDDGNFCCRFGPGEDQISFWSSDGRAEIDDSDFVSDADIVYFPLF